MAVMGTNYYVVTKACEKCGKGSERLHIGKSSAGWVFALNTHPEVGISHIADWLAFLPGKPIEDEYGAEVKLGRMIEIICDRGPSGSLHRSGRRGEGTWDYHTGDFC